MARAGRAEFGLTARLSEPDPCFWSLTREVLGGGPGEARCEVLFFKFEWLDLLLR